MTTTTMQFSEATNAVQNAQTILVVTHMMPDGDAIGSLLGLTHGLRQLGKTVDAAVDGGVPEFLAFLPGSETVYDNLKAGQWDLMISVDSSDEVRTGDAGAYGREHSGTVINLDHHATNIMFGDVFLVDPQAVSATQVVFSWLDYMDVALNEDISAPLLTGLLTDTIGFRTNNCSTTTLEIAQQLMQAGASLPEITARALDSRSILQVNLWKHALPSVELHKHGVIVAEVRQQDIKRAGLNELTDGGLVGFLNQVKEAVIAIVFKERNDGDVEISMRAKTGYDVSQIALELGGGGHKQAAGATIPGPVEEARKRVLPMLKDAAKRGTPTFG